MSSHLSVLWFPIYSKMMLALNWTTNCSFIQSFWILYSWTVKTVKDFDSKMKWNEKFKIVYVFCMENCLHIYIMVAISYKSKPRKFVCLVFKYERSAKHWRKFNNNFACDVQPQTKTTTKIQKMRFSAIFFRMVFWTVSYSSTQHKS